METDNLRREAELCVYMLQIFQSGVGILDECDLILHPLKSELNWPLGSKMMLDFTSSRTLGDGLRWFVPWVLSELLLGAAVIVQKQTAIQANGSETSEALQELGNTSLAPESFQSGELWSFGKVGTWSR